MWIKARKLTVLIVFSSLQDVLNNFIKHIGHHV